MHPRQEVSGRGDFKPSIDEKKAKKRELDRICQRRKRTKDRDERRKLEDRVMFLQQEKDDDFMKQLLLERDCNEERAVRQKNRLLQMQALVEADLAEFDTAQRGTTNVPSFDDSIEDKSAASPYPVTQVAQSTLSIQHENPCPSEVFPRLDPMEQEWPPEILTPDNSFDPLAPVPIPNRRTNNRIWKRIERLIAQAQQEFSNRVTQSTELDMHIIITAISIGWAPVAQVFPLLDSRWQCLRQLDEEYFMPNYGKIERLAVLLIASQVFKLDLHCSTASDWTQLLPRFVKPRPSQLAFPHSVIADCYVWPGFRERLSFCHDYHTDEFLHATYSNFRFQWPHDIKDAYAVNQRTGLYEITKCFLSSVQDLHCWTMNSDFLKMYPDFQGDVPVSNPRTKELGLSAAQGQYYYFLDRCRVDQAEDNSVGDTTSAVVAGSVIWPSAWNELLL